MSSRRQSIKQTSGEKRSGLSATIRTIRRDIWIYVLLLPGLLYFLVFKYIPMWGVIISFQEFNPFIGMMESEWVGLAHFRRFFMHPAFFQLLRNTFMLAIYNLVLYFPLPIVLALMLNEMRSNGLRRAVQTMIYVPHFISWIVVVGISYVMFTPQGGIVNEMVVRLGGKELDLLWNASTFRLFYTAQVMWKEAGWGTIIFLAALAGVDVEMYEASYIDGANRFQRIWHITLPSIRSTIIVMLILRMGNFLNTGFEHIYAMTNAMNREVAEVFDTYVYSTGILNGDYSYSTAVGLFKSVVGLILVLSTDRLAKLVGEEGIY